MEPRLKWNKIILAPHVGIFVRQLLQPITAFVYCNCQTAPAGRRQQASDGEQHAFQAPVGACATERAPELVSWLITRFRNRVPGCWNRVTRIRLYYIFFFLNSCLFIWPRYVIGQTIYIFILWFLLSFFLSSFFSSPNISSRRLDVYHPHTVWP